MTNYNSSIIGYVGPPGSGKTFSMVRDAVEFVRRTKCDVYTNMAGLKFPEAVYINGLDDLVHVTNGLVLFDEVGVSMSSRFWQSVSRDVLMRMAQVRKDGLSFWWTAQSENRVDTVVREISHYYRRCSKIGKWFRSSQVMPEAPTKPFASKVYGYSPMIARLYDTREVISSEGGSAGKSSQEMPLSLRARRRHAEDAQRRGRGGEWTCPPLFYSDWTNGLTVPAARTVAAYRYLEENGWLAKPEITPEAAEAEGVSWQAQVRRELERRAWLRVFGLDPDEVPYYCTPRNPWLAGYSPAAVQQRAAELAAKDAEEEAAELRKHAREASKRNRRAQSAAGFEIVREAVA